MVGETRQFWNGQLEHAAIIPDFAAWQDRHEALSAQADALGMPERIPTGADDLQALWRTKLGRATHGLLYIHGGFWRRYAAHDFSFVAETAAAANVTFYNVDYRLVPLVRMKEAVDDVVAACAIAREACDRLVVVGHSAGAHLAVEAAMRMERPPDHVVAISGIYDLAPLRFAFIQDELGLSDEEVATFSPIFRAASMPCPVHIRVGAAETAEFQRQSVRFFETVSEAGRTATIEFMQAHHHSSIVAELADSNTVLSHLVQSLLH
ncbi:hypothetical protein ATO13_00230 [Stappia sp. 22II-S9-Z10]|nr:hypothetical protein ATO13_00230 [Stappia sp. 22II-S9-Z10]